MEPWVNELVDLWATDQAATLTRLVIARGEDSSGLLMAHLGHRLGPAFIEAYAAAHSAADAEFSTGHVAAYEGRFDEADGEAVRLAAKYGEFATRVLDLQRVIRFKKFQFKLPAKAGERSEQ